MLANDAKMPTKASLSAAALSASGESASTLGASMTGGSKHSTADSHRSAGLRAGNGSSNGNGSHASTAPSSVAAAAALAPSASAMAAPIEVLPTSLTTTAQQLLPTSVLRNLYDKLYEKRKAAALEVEQIVKSLAGAGDLHRVHALLSMLVRDYALSPLSNHRKGGLIGLAAATVGLVGNFATFLPLIVPPVLRSFNDAENRVRYYACEALYNIAKVARDEFVVFFNDVFDALCRLSADVDPNVQNAAQLLDKLVKDIVTESPHFDIVEFIKLLRVRLQVSNPYVRQFLVGWISVLDSVPDIGMLEYLPEFLDGLFNMLSDPNRDIRQQADMTLGEFLSEIKSQHAPTSHGRGGEPGAGSPPRRTSRSGSAATSEPESTFNFGRIVRILVVKATSTDEFTQLTALAWLQSFVELAGTQLIADFPNVLDAVLPCLSHPNPKMCQVAEGTNRALLKLDTASFEGFDASGTIKVVKKHLETSTRAEGGQGARSTGAGMGGGMGTGMNAGMDGGEDYEAADGEVPRGVEGRAGPNGEKTWLEALKWLSILLSRYHEEVLACLDELLPLLLDATADGNDTVVLQALNVEASLAKNRPEFKRLISALLDRFRGEKGKRLLQERGTHDRPTDRPIDRDAGIAGVGAAALSCLRLPSSLSQDTNQRTRTLARIFAHTRRLRRVQGRW